MEFSNELKSKELKSQTCRRHANELSRYRARSGQLLLEMILAIAAVAIVAAIVGQLLYANLRSSKSGSEKNTATGLMIEEFEGVRNATLEKWNNLYNITHGTGTTYYAVASGSKWTVATGTDNVTISTIVFSRSFTAQHICRNTVTRNITGITDSGGTATSSCTTSGGSFDPSTEQVIAVISWPNATAVSSSEYVTRWRNLTCAQTSWTSTSSNATSCPAGVYETSSNMTGSSTLQICLGGC